MKQLISIYPSDRGIHYRHCNFVQWNASCKCLCIRTRLRFWICLYRYKWNYMISGLQNGNYIISVSPPYGGNFITNSIMVHVSRMKQLLPILSFRRRHRHRHCNFVQWNSSCQMPMCTHKAQVLDMPIQI